MKVEHLSDNVTLYLGDSREIDLPAGAVLSDPPYGQKQNTNVRFAGGVRKVVPPRSGARAIENARRATLAASQDANASGVAIEWPEGIEGDDETFDPARLLRMSTQVLLWGAHRFSDRMPAGSWLVWDKVPTGKIRDQGDGEAAWMSGPIRPMRIYRLLWDGVCVGAAARDEVTAGQQRVHPTQKPVVLMKWCIEQMRLAPGTTIIDPYMGAGSTGVAAVKMGFPFCDAEIVPRFFDTSCRRISSALQQPDFFQGGHRA